MVLRLCSNLNSASDVTSPQVGTGGSELGAPTYEACKIGNGIYSIVNPEGCIFPTGANNINMSKGAIECWVKIKFLPIDPDVHQMWSFVQFVGSDYHGGIAFNYETPASNFRVTVLNNNNSQALAIWDPTFTWNLNDIVHFAVSWDRSRVSIGNSKSIVLKINNVERASSTALWDSGVIPNPNLYVGINTRQWYHSDAVIDNLKTYDTCKLDFSDSLVACSYAIYLPTELLCCDEASSIGPTGLCVPAKVDKSPVYFSAIYNDPDAEDTAESYQIQVSDSTSFLGTLLWDSGKTSMSPVTEGERCENITYAGSNLYSGTTFYWRIKFWDAAGNEGAWSNIVCFKRIMLRPTNLLCGGETNPIQAKNISFSAIYNDSNKAGASIHYQIRVNTDPDFGIRTKVWNSTKTQMTKIREGERCADVPYIGTTILQVGVRYYWRIKFWNEGGIEGLWSEELAYFELFNPGGNGPPPGGDGPTPPGGHPAFKPAYKLSVGKNVIQCESDKGNLLDCNFTLRRDGGCAEFDFTLGAPYFKPINLGDEVNIYVFGQTTQWFRGRVMERDHPGSSNRARKYSGYGHFEQLNGCDLVDVEYGTGFAITDLRLAVIDILDTDVRPYTSLITANNSKIADPLYTITHVKFDKVKPIDALRDLAELAQNYEFGVDEIGDFYFRANSTAILYKKWVGKHVKSLLPTENIRTLRNFLYLEGGQLTAGSNYDSAIWDAASIVAYGRRADKVTIPSNMDTSEIGRWGNDLLAKTKDPITKTVIIGVDVERTETRIWPRGQMRCTSEDGRYVFDKAIIAVTYHLTPAGITSADVQLGEKLASLRQQIRDVEKKVIKEQEQLASDVLQLATGSGSVALMESMVLVYLALFNK